MFYQLFAVYSAGRQLAERVRHLSANPKDIVHPSDEIRQQRDDTRNKVNQLEKEAARIQDIQGDVPLHIGLEIADKTAQVKELEDLLQMIRWWDEV